MDHDRIIIRPTSWADLNEVSVLLERTWHATYDPIYGPERVAELTRRWHSVEALASGMDRDDVVFLVAEQDDTILVGTASLHATGPTDAVLDRIYVAPDAQGQGIGWQLFLACREAAGPSRRITLEVEPANTSAIAFYERAGFTATGTTNDCGSTGDAIPATVMTLTP